MNEEIINRNARGDVLRLAADVVSAYVGRNAIPSAQLSGVIQTVYASLNHVGQLGRDGRAEPPKAAVPIKKSVHDDYLICLEDGAKLKMLKRHLRTRFGLTPDEYRAKWSLPADYPMVAPNYAEQRSAFAKKIGLGRKPISVEKPARRGRAAR